MKIELDQVLMQLFTAWNVQFLRLDGSGKTKIEHIDLGIRKKMDPGRDWEKFRQVLEEHVPDHTIVFGDDIFKLHYAFFRDPGEGALCSIGPWCTARLQIGEMSWAQERIPQENIAEMQEFYNIIPVEKTEEIENTICTLVSMYYEDGAPEILHTAESVPFSFEASGAPVFRSTFIREDSIEVLNQRWLKKQRICEAVFLGKKNETRKACRQGPTLHFLRYWPDSLYNARMEAMILNTLLMETADQAKVPPYYTHEIFETYAGKIQQLHTVDTGELFLSMAEAYCDSVRNWSLGKYPAPLRRVIDVMRVNLKENHTPQELAEISGISLRQLNRLFREETGYSMMEYLNRERIGMAEKLLITTPNSVYEIAEEVGIMDANYFSRLFRQITGETPTAYRKNRFSRTAVLYGEKSET